MTPPSRCSSRSRSDRVETSLVRWLATGAAGLLLLLSVYLLLDNVEVDVSAVDMGESRPAGQVGCPIAPWDAGFNDNRSRPGGEHSQAYGDEVADECSEASTLRFRAGVVIGVLGLFVLGVGSTAGLWGRRSQESAEGLTNEHLFE